MYIAQITNHRLQIVNCAIYAILQVTGCRLQVTDYKFQVIGLMLKNISEIKNSRKLLNALTLKLIVDCVHGVHTQRCNGKAFSTRFNYTR